MVGKLGLKARYVIVLYGMVAGLPAAGKGVRAVSSPIIME